MRRLIKQIVSRTARPFVNQVELALGSKFVNNEVVAQKLLIQQYRNLARNGGADLPKFNDVGFRKYSQFEEDGILLYIFSLVAPINRTCVEICAGSGRECMAANLIINHGWRACLFDGNEHNVNAGREFYTKNKDTFLDPPVYTQAWVTAENVNALIERAGMKGAIDLLSLDVDGIDYWLWKAISVVQPTVVVCETHNMIPADEALTVPYDANFACISEDFRGASLAAMCKLSREKGYRLIGAHRFGFNAFFMKDGIGEEFFPEVDVASCLCDPVTVRLRAERWPAVQKLGWQRV
jgi:hypothetical protein